MRNSGEPPVHARHAAGAGVDEDGVEVDLGDARVRVQQGEQPVGNPRDLLRRHRGAAAQEPADGRAGQQIGEQLVEPADLRRIALEMAGGGLGLARLDFQEGVVFALDRLHVHAGAEIAGAGVEGRVGPLDDDLTAVSGSVDVSDVVTGRDQPGLRAVEARDADTE